MKIQPYTRMIIVGAVTLSLCLFLVGVLVTTYSMGETLAVVDDEDASVSPSAVTGLLVPQSTAAYNGVITPSQTVFVPWLLGGTSVLRVYNAGHAPAVVQATFSYTDPGASVPVGVGAVAEIRATAVPTGTMFSAILASTQPIAVVANDSGPVGQYATSYSAMSPSVGKRELALPDIFFEAPGGWESDIALQNVGVTTASVTVIYTKTNEPFTTTNWIDDSITDLGPGETSFFGPGQAGVPGKFVGVATVHSDQPVIAVVRNAAAVIGTIHPDRAYVYRVPLPGPMSESGRTLYFPLLVNAFEDWKNSEIQIFNAGPTGVAYSLEIGDTARPEFVEGWSVDSFPQDEAGSQSPPGEAVAGRVENARTLQSLVWLNGEGRFIGDFLAVYSTPSTGAETWYLPFTDQSDRLATEVAVQNPGGAAVNISITYHSLTGTMGAFHDSIPGSDMAVYATDDYVLSDFAGGVVVEADRPVIAVTLIAGRLVLDKEIYLPIAFRK